MDQKDFSKYLQKFSQNIAQALPAINEKVALNAYAMMRNRIIEDGTIGENKSLGEYSDHKLPTFFFKGKELNSKGRKALETADKKQEGISYKEWREANNRPTEHVTMSFSGTTLNDIGVTKSLMEGIRIVTIVGPKNSKTRMDGKTTEEIVGYLQEMYGDFIKPNKEEMKLLQDTLSIEVNKVIQKNL